jgi:hypothetical protein
VPFDDVRLGGLLGKGSFGSVFIGVAGGTPCAVKARDPLGLRLSVRGWAESVPNFANRVLRAGSLARHKPC